MLVLRWLAQGGKGFFRDPLLGQKQARDSLLDCQKCNRDPLLP